MNIITDRFLAGTKEYNGLYDLLFNNYFPTFTMELEDCDNRNCETYRVNVIHRVDVIHGQEIIVQKNYYYYN